ncbi:MAG: M23 family metallopeptidase [Elusimicrobia bacterium]|nr:M23 family metallopeptidase [Elusimicrobiota bacterium]
MSPRSLLIAAAASAAAAVAGLVAVARFGAGPEELAVPVVDVTPASCLSTWGAPRSGGRRHRGIDIFAPRGTPVVASAAGFVFKAGRSGLGGNVVWVAGAGGRLYYYAHLDRFRERLGFGSWVAAGDTLGYVGNTGNAASTPPHLHFGVYPASQGFFPVDPAPLLQRAGRTTVSTGR